MIATLGLLNNLCNKQELNKINYTLHALEQNDVIGKNIKKLVKNFKNRY
jgi:hypothetical protein